jgi:4-hydroxybenzoate polyprenyltransferase
VGVADTTAGSAARGHPAGALGILHPFPSVLVSLVVAVLAALAGGTVIAIVTLTVAMFGFQASIGATNDLADLPRDRLLGARKPLPAGQGSVRMARSMAVAGGMVGLGLSATFGPLLLLVGAAGYACGIGYDLWLRTRRLAWLAFAAAFPLLLAYAWLGAAGILPPKWPLLLPMAAAIGPALHLSNSLIDVDTDAADPAGGLASRLGRSRSLVVLTVLLVVVYALAWAAILAGVATGTGGTGSAYQQEAPIATFGMLVATLMAAAGIGLSASHRRSRRMAGWAAQAIAAALLGVAWIASVALA